MKLNFILLGLLGSSSCLNAFAPPSPLVKHHQALTTSSYRRILYATVPQEDQRQDVEAPVFVEAASPKILGEGIPYEELTIGVLNEYYPGENRVSQTPDSVRSLVKAGFKVIIQSGGTLSYCSQSFCPFSIRDL